jgi:hypothetical protein
MKMSSRFFAPAALVLLSAFAARTTWARPLSAGRDAAYQICSSFTFSSDQNACIDVVKNSYFELGAVNICAALTFTNEKIDCLRKIKDKSYDPQIVQLCAGQTFISDKLQCLATNGRDIGGYPEPDVAYLRSGIQSALNRLYRNDNAGARHILEDLLNNVGQP